MNTDDKKDDRVAFSWIELILILLLVLLAMGIFGLAELGVQARQSDGEKMIEVRAEAGVPQAEAELAVAVGVRDGLQEALAKEKVNSEGEASKISELETQLSEAVAGVTTAEETVAVSEGLEAQKWQQYIRERQLSVLFWAFTLTAIVLFFGTMAVTFSGILKDWKINGYEVLGATTALVVLLYGFRAFDWVGVAAAAVLVLIGLGIAAWRWRRRTGSAEPQGQTAGESGQ